MTRFFWLLFIGLGLVGVAYPAADAGLFGESLLATLPGWVAAARAASIVQCASALAIALPPCYLVHRGLIALRIAMIQRQQRNAKFLPGLVVLHQSTFHRLLGWFRMPGVLVKAYVFLAVFLLVLVVLVQHGGAALQSLKATVIYLPVLFVALTTLLVATGFVLALVLSFADGVISLFVGFGLATVSPLRLLGSRQGRRGSAGAAK